MAERDLFAEAMSIQDPEQRRKALAQLDSQTLQQGLGYIEQGQAEAQSNAGQKNVYWTDPRTGAPSSFEQVMATYEQDYSEVSGILSERQSAKSAANKAAGTPGGRQSSPQRSALDMTDQSILTQMQKGKSILGFS